ncbi:MAG: biotin--[acetyl-CoA-carboxylase] ligase [Prevotellaceae bacterium]|nr:biotin--[acetyl-CoA-carboxylase] ligase [Prevotellaceae bacterium]
MSTTAFSELPPHWQRHHFAEVPTTMELLREDALEERALIEEERRRRKENSESSKREHAQGVNIPGKESQSKHALCKEEKEKKEGKGEIIEEELPEQTPLHQKAQNEHALYNKNKKTEKNGKYTPDENASNKKIVLNNKRAEEIQLVTTDYQTHGHGQVNTVWESARGENLLFSFLFRPEHITAGVQFFLSEIACLAVAHTLDAYTEGISVKWPNDVYHHDRKICGMLLRHTLSGAQIAATLVGIGLNLNQKQFVGDAPNPVSLRQIIGRPVDREEVLNRFAHHFDRLLRAVTPPDPDERLAQRQRLHREYLRRLYHRDGAHDYVDTASGETFSAHIVDVAPTGQLTLRTTDGRLRHYHFKEVRFVVPLPTTATAHV